VLLDIFIIRDPDYSTIKVFTSEVKAKNFVSYNKKSELEHVELEIPYAAIEPHRVLSLVNQEKANEKIKTMEQLVRDHIDYVVYEACGGNIAKASRVLDMSESNLRHKLKQLGLK
jgi:DNA-binding NtrC family response regulator